MARKTPETAPVPAPPMVAIVTACVDLIGVDVPEGHKLHGCPDTLIEEGGKYRADHPLVAAYPQFFVSLNDDDEHVARAKASLHRFQPVDNDTGIEIDGVYPAGTRGLMFGDAA